MRSLGLLYATVGPPAVLLVLGPWPLPARVLVALVWLAVAGLVASFRAPWAAPRRRVSYRNWRTGRVRYARRRW